ncbi:MAG TPA: YfjI family protein [Thermodesulfobacteriota bacterium]|nr:YfjI family protein [Thermodesulfobacteriota bacterium]
MENKTSNPQMILKTLSLFHQPGDVVELRIPDTPQRTVSGYFDDMQALCNAAVKYSGRVPGIYISLNSVNKDLLARCYNREKGYVKTTTADKDILGRGWFLVDADPIRPKGISSTDVEHQLALEKSKKIRDFLKSNLRWPDPIRADSGNGGHLDYRIALPNDEESRDLLERCLKAIDYVSADDKIAIDTTVYNASRVAKLYGTMACKGDNVPERPHRMSEILEIPERIEIVSREQLLDLARLKPEPPKQERRFYVSAGVPLDIERFMSKHGLSVRRTKPWEGGTVYELNERPFDPEHNSGEARIIQFPNGALSFGCFHNSCQAYDWHTLRDKIEPDRAGKYNSNGHDKDATWTAPTFSHKEKPADDEEQGTITPLLKAEPLPVEVFPEMLQPIIKEIATAINCPLDFVGVPIIRAAGLAVGTSRVIQIKPGWTEGARIFAAVVDRPGSKKSPALYAALSPINQIQKHMQKYYEKKKEQYKEEFAQYESVLLKWKRDEGSSPKPGKPEEPIMSQIITTDSTLEALAELLEQNPRGILFARDELTGWALSMDQYRGGKGADRQAWLSFWNGGQVIINRKNRKTPIVLDNPFVCVVGSLPPDVLNDLSDERGREDGFIHRILFAYPEPHPLAWTEDEISPESLDTLNEVFSKLIDLQPGIDEEGGDKPLILTFTPEGKKMWRAFINEHYAEQNNTPFPDNLCGPWAKMEGYAARLALILHVLRLACGETTEQNVDEFSMAGAADLIDYFKSHAERVYTHLKFSPEDKRILNAIAWIKRKGGTVTAREVQRYRVAEVKTSEGAKQFLELLNKRGYGTIEHGDKGSVVFKLTCTYSTLNT